MPERVLTSNVKAFLFAKRLRRRQTSTELLVWSKLRAKRLAGYKFKRQVPIGPFIVDFLCYQKRLVIEIDGASHFLRGAREYDLMREEYLRQKGLRTIRFSNKRVHSALDEVLEEIVEALASYSTSP